MAKILASDLANLYEFGLSADPASPNTAYRMYFDLNQGLLYMVNSTFDIIDTYVGLSTALAPATEKVAKQDICVINDQGLNSYPANGNQIYRMYIAEREITIFSEGLPQIVPQSILIVNQNFQILWVIPLSAPTPVTMPSTYVTVSYDYGLNAEAAAGNYIWHMYYGDFDQEGGRLTPGALMIVNQNFEVVYYASPV
jgi:hypothetical protein